MSWKDSLGEIRQALLDAITIRGRVDWRIMAIFYLGFALFSILGYYGKVPPKSWDHLYLPGAFVLAHGLAIVCPALTKKWTTKIKFSPEGYLEYGQVLGHLILYVLFSAIYFWLLLIPAPPAGFYLILTLIYLPLKLYLGWQIVNSIKSGRLSDFMALFAILFCLVDVFFFIPLHAEEIGTLTPSATEILKIFVRPELAVPAFSIVSIFLYHVQRPRLLNMPRFPLPPLIILGGLMIAGFMAFSFSPTVRNLSISEQMQAVNLMSHSVFVLNVLFLYIMLAYNTSYITKGGTPDGLVRINGRFAGKIELCTQFNMFGVNLPFKNVKELLILKHKKKTFNVLVPAASMAVLPLTAIMPWDAVSVIGYYTKEIVKDGINSYSETVVVPLAAKITKESVFRRRLW